MLAALLPAEHVKAGDPYALVVVLAGHAYDAGETFTADLRVEAKATSPVVASFSVATRAGVPGDVTGEDETGSTVITLGLTGLQTRALEATASHVFDVQLAGGSTIAEGRLEVEGDVTR